LELSLLAHLYARPARRRLSSRDSLKNLSPVTKTTSAGLSSEHVLMPLGALMLAASVSCWAQSTTPAPESGIASTTQVEGKSLTPVTVTGTRDRAAQTYQSGVTSVGKMPVAAKDIPQSLTVINDKLIHDQGKDSFKSALENVIGITFEAGEGGRVGDNIRLRGFSAAGDIYLDGMRDIAQYNRDLFNIDRVEVLRGSASMLFGRGSTGGIVSQVSKQPRLITEQEVNATIKAISISSLMTMPPCASMPWRPTATGAATMPAHPPIDAAWRLTTASALAPPTNSQSAITTCITTTSPTGVSSGWRASRRPRPPTNTGTAWTATSRKTRPMC
jgi:outer membrane receptor protein involved in Fe transport